MRASLGALAVGAPVALASPAAAEEPLRGHDMAWGGTTAVVVGSVGWVVGLNVLHAADRAPSDCGKRAPASGNAFGSMGGDSLCKGIEQAGRQLPGVIVAGLGDAAVTLGVAFALTGALQKNARNEALAIAGIPFATVGAGALVAGTSYLAVEKGRLAGAALTAAGVGLSALGLTLYLAGNRRAEAPAKPRAPQQPAPENHWITIGPMGGEAGFRF